MSEQPKDKRVPIENIIRVSGFSGLDQVVIVEPKSTGIATISVHFRDADFESIGATQIIENDWREMGKLMRWIMPD